MKTLAILCFAAASIGLVASADAQTAAANTSRNNSRATAAGTITRSNSRNFVRQQRRAETATFTAPQRTDGVIARTVRASDPVQMFNPLAPAEYGTGREVTRHEVDDPFQRPYGIRLVTVEF